MHHTVPEDHTDTVEYHITHPELLPPEDEENLDHNGSSIRPQQSKRSMLGEVSNQDKLPGVLKHKSQNLRSTGHLVTWADRVHRNFQLFALVSHLLTTQVIIPTYLHM